MRVGLAAGLSLPGHPPGIGQRGDEAIEHQHRGSEAVVVLQKEEVRHLATLFHRPFRWRLNRRAGGVDEVHGEQPVGASLPDLRALHVGDGLHAALATDPALHHALQHFERVRAVCRE